jgi:hypothetical protein
MTNPRFQALIMALTVFLAMVYLLTSPAAAEVVTLRPAPQALGGAITLGDVFDTQNPEARRAIAPAPRPGQTARLPARTLAAAASAAGLQWTPPADLREVEVQGPPATNRLAQPQAMSAAAPLAGGEVLIRRGEAVTLIYETASVRLTARGRALADAREDGPIRVTNLQSNRTIDAIAAGPGLARVVPTAGQ